MIKRIKFSIFCLLILLTSGTYAQTFSIDAGVGFTNMLTEEGEFFIPYNTNDFSSGLIPGYHFGGTANFKLFDLFSLKSGLNISSNGLIKKDEEIYQQISLITKEKYSLFFIQLPLAIEVPFKIANIDVYSSLGSYVGIGIFGTMKTTSTFGDIVDSDSRNISWGTDPIHDDFLRLDYGISGGAGISFNALSLGLFYQYGLANMSPEFDYGTKYNNRAFGISLAYTFGNLKSGGNKDTRRKDQVVPGDNKPNETRRSDLKEIESQEDRSRQKNDEIARIEKLGGDSIAEIESRAMAEAEMIRLEKIREDSINSIRLANEKLEEERVKREEAQADSILAARKAEEMEAAKNKVVYRVQFASTSSAKGNYSIKVGNRDYTTWEYFYKGAYRSTVGEFSTLDEAIAFQRTVRQSGFDQGFVVAFKGGERSTDPSLFK